MVISRRLFLQAITLGMSAGVALLDTHAASAQPPLSPQAASPQDSGAGLARIPSTSLVAPDYLRRSVYIPLVSTLFKVTARGMAGVLVRLIEVNYIPFAPRDKWMASVGQDDSGGIITDTDSFALVFVGPARRPLKQGIYTVVHPALGRIPLFLVPHGVGKRGFYYEAVINRSNV